MKALSAPDLFMLIISAFLHDIGMAPDEKYILAWKNQLPEEEYDEELKEEREKFSRFRLTYTHQLADIERLIAEKEFSKAQLLEDYIVTEYIRTNSSKRNYCNILGRKNSISRYGFNGRVSNNLL